MSDRADGSPTIPPAGPDRQAWLKRFAKLWGFALFIVVVAWMFRGVLLPFVFAILVAYILAPAVNRLSKVRISRRRTMPRGAAVLLCYLVVVSALVLFFSAFLPRLSGDFARLGAEAPKLWERINKEYTPRAARWLESRFPSLKEKPTAPPDDDVGPPGEPPPPPGTVMTVTPLASGDYAITIDQRGIEIERDGDQRMIIRPRQEAPKKKLEDLLRERIVRAIAGLESEVGDVLRFGQAVVAGVIGAIMQLVIVLMVAGFILIDIDRIHAFARGVIPARYRGDYDHVVAGIDRGLNGVIRGQLLICLVNGILTYMGLLIFDVKYGILLAVIAGVLSLIPIFGTVLSTIPIVAIALVSGPSGVDVLRGVFILLWILGIHFVEANFLNPNIIGSAAKMHPVLVIFALIAGEHTYGLVGALLAVPVASIIQTLFVYFRSQAWKSDAAGSTGVTAAPPPPAAPPAAQV